MKFSTVMTCSVVFFVVYVDITRGYTPRRIFRECLERELEESQDMADVVATATVERVLHPTGHTVSIRVRRVFKGPPALNGSVMVVEDLANPTWCDAKLKERDTRLFLLQTLGPAKLKTVSSPFRITLANLDRVVAAIKDEPYRRRGYIADLPCEAKYCAHNGDCSDTRNGGATCRCPISCPFDPTTSSVCGNDKKTYMNHCRLRIESCRKSERVWVEHLGQCGLTATASA